MTTTEIKNKGQKALWSEGFITNVNKKPFFRIDILSKEESETYHNGKPFLIFLQGASFNKEMHNLIIEKKFGEYDLYVKTELADFEWYYPEEYKMCLDKEGFPIIKLVPARYKSYLYSVSNIDCILDKIIEVEAAVYKDKIPALEIIL